MENQNTHNPAKLRLTIYLMVTAIILIIPLIAMQFTKEVTWTFLDFAVAGILLLSTAAALEIVIRNVKTSILRSALFVVILLVLFLIWAELAVGIFGTPFAGS